ncbi:hypothetical protein AOA14_04340 [Sphingopyxis terrae subsp. terrae NBRC 15098]|uniref:Uncharacterized protein n=1 Tax=Sphingopyxis terrae subsp. terrae NBRC 15098 TaxID=1219058 RepID=A0A142VVS0_9SPHN|nr:hypothetical protein AOA14_04340 [Sphingopyxis terrae subsp. terrae NBRC 15098]
MGRELCGQASLEPVIEGIMQHSLGDGIEKEQPLFAVLAALQRVALRLSRHPQLLKREPARIGSDNARGATVAADKNLVDGSSLKQPFLFGKWYGLRPVDPRHGSRSRGRCQYFHLIGFGVARLKAALGIDREGRVDRFQQVPDDLRIVLWIGLGPRKIEISGLVRKFGNEATGLERIGGDRIGADDEQGAAEKTAPVGLAQNRPGLVGDHWHPHRAGDRGALAKRSPACRAARLQRLLLIFISVKARGLLIGPGTKALRIAPAVEQLVQIGAPCHLLARKIIGELREPAFGFDPDLVLLTQID